METETIEKPSGSDKADELVGCPFCGAKPIHHEGDDYKVYHDSECYIAMNAENSG